MCVSDQWGTAYYINEEVNENHNSTGGYGDAYDGVKKIVTITDNGFSFNLNTHIQPTNQLNDIHYYIAI